MLGLAFLPSLLLCKQVLIGVWGAISANPINETIRYFMKELLMLNDTVMKYSVHFSIWHQPKKDSATLCKQARVDTEGETIRALRGGDNNR
jgi:hypothetical protein